MGRGKRERSWATFLVPLANLWGRSFGLGWGGAAGEGAAVEVWESRPNRALATPGSVPMGGGASCSGVGQELELDCVFHLSRQNRRETPEVCHVAGSGDMLASLVCSDGAPGHEECGNFEIVASTIKAIYDQTCRSCGLINRLVIYMPTEGKQVRKMRIDHIVGDTAAKQKWLRPDKRQSEALGLVSDKRQKDEAARSRPQWDNRPWWQSSGWASSSSSWRWQDW